MEILKNPEKAETLFARLRNGARGVLFCDYDGTLAPFREDPAAALPYPWVPATLQAIAGGGTRIALVTGRAARDLQKLIPSLSLEIWGSHGRERLQPDGQNWTWTPDPQDERRLTLIENELETRLPDVRMEKKIGCLAIHWRGFPEQKVATMRQTIDELRQRWDPDAVLLVKPFQQGLELQVSGPNKGDVIDAVLAEEAGTNLAVCYIGDDWTDEDAFHALGDRGLNVLVGGAARPTAADIRLDNEAQVRSFLERWQNITSGGPDHDP